MNKDLLTTIIGFAGAAVVAANEYLTVQAGVEDYGSIQFWIGMGSAVLVALFGYWSKKGPSVPVEPSK